MIPLQEMKISSEALSKGLKENGQRHRSYNIYTSMERAMALALTGNLYITNGQKWNDIPDRTIMQNNHAYGICFSCSTLENIAMWMLYSADHGKRGAMLQFPPFIMKEILEREEIEAGYFNNNGEFEATASLSKAEGDYEIFLTDVVYTDYQKEKTGEIKNVILSCWEDHELVPIELLAGEDIFHKHYAWSYEKECRLIIKPKKAMDENAIMRIHLSERAKREITERIVRSPILQNKVDFGKVSVLQGKVDW